MTAHLLACIFGIARRHNRRKSDAIDFDESEFLGMIKGSAAAGSLYAALLIALTPEQSYSLAFGLLGSEGRKRLVREFMAYDEPPFDYGAVGEPVLSALDALNERTPGWDGYDAPAPDARAVAAAMEWVKQFCGVVSAAGMAWEAPYVSSDEAGNVSLEWWHERRNLTVYVTPASVEYLKAWGANIHTEMADGVIACPTDALALWEWLHSDALPLISRREAEAAEARRRAAAVESRGNGE